MDTLYFQIELRPQTIQGIVAIPIINGISLIEYVKELEGKYNPTIVGSYDGMRPKFLSGELENGSIHDRFKSKILECECGVDGCWSLLMKVTKTDKTVIWSDFEQIHEEDWDFSSLRFEFEIVQYESVVSHLDIYIHN